MLFIQEIPTFQSVLTYWNVLNCIRFRPFIGHALSEDLFVSFLEFHQHSCSAESRELFSAFGNVGSQSSYSEI